MVVRRGLAVTRRGRVAGKNLSSPGRRRLQPDKLSSSDGQTIGPYGLTRVDYSQPPHAWALPPPPPPRQSPVRRYLALFLATFTFGAGVYIYFNQDESVYEYWEQVEQGHAPVTFGVADADDDAEDDEDEWEDDDEEDEKTK
jgi:hypothetical protein